MRNFLIMAVVALGLGLAGMTQTASAHDRHWGGRNNWNGRGNWGWNGGYNRGWGGNFRRGHYDYHPPVVVPHFDHYHVVPGHLHYHRGGHNHW